MSRLILAKADDRTCYFLDGSEATGHVPCHPTRNTVNCFNSSDICLNNGLCLLQGCQGLAFARGSCSDKGGGTERFAPCSTYRRHTGLPIMGVRYNKSASTCCSGALHADNNEVKCMYDEPFQISEGLVLPDVECLENNGNQNSTSDTPTDCRSNSSCLAVEVAVGVPLGAMAVASFVWALWERRKRQHSSSFTVINSGFGLAPHGSRQIRTAEPSALSPTSNLPELMDTPAEYKEIPSESNLSRT